METLQDRVNALQMSTQVALDHLESVPEKLSLLEDFKDFRDSCSSSEKMDGRYSKYRTHRDSLQQCLELDTKHRIKNLKHDRSFSEGSHARSLDHSSSWQDCGHFLSSPRFLHLNSLPTLTRRTIAPDSGLIKEDATSLPVNGTSLQSKEEEYESKKSKM